jgi:branched-chain amino acid transport system permease protein
LSSRSDDATSKKSKFEEVVGHRPSLLMFLPIVLLGLAAFFPGTTNDLGELDTGVFILLAAMAATGLGLVIGLAGQFSLGQAGFVLVSGYTAAILTADHGWNPFLALIVAVGASVVIGTLIGMLTLRLEGLNLALATLALLVIAVVVVTQAEGLTHGSAGVQGVSGLEFFGLKVESSQDFFLVCLGTLAAMLLIARNIWYSRMGRSLRAIGIDQEAAESVGLDAWRMKLAIFVLGASMAGVSGVLWTYYLHYAANDTWGVKLTIELVTFVVVGGAVSPYGAAVGATAVGLLQYWFREHVGTSIGGASSSYEVVLSGALIIIFVLVFRRGLASIPQALAERIERRRAAGGDAEEPAAAAPAGVGSWVREGGADVPVVSEVGPSAQTSSSSLPLVVVEDLTKRFGDLIAVNGVSLDLRPGEVTAMIGPNGAGKSTVVNMLAGGLVPSAGSVGILGRPLVGLRPQRIAQLGLARTFQTPRLFDGMTVLETVMLARDRYGSRSWIWSNALRTPRSLRDERAARERALEWLAFVGLAEDAELPANTLPVGKQRMAEVARALATEPAVLLLDEPAAGLDGRETVGLAALIRELGNAGIAVLLVEHDMAMVMSIADQIVVLEEGKKIAEGTPAEIGSDQTVIDAYLGVVHA